MATTGNLLHTSAKAVHSWSLFRTLGRYVAPGSMPSGDLPEGGGEGIDLLDLPAELASHGYCSVQLCHFYLPSRDAGYLQELRQAFDDVDVQVECVLIDDGDLTHPTHSQAHQDWLSTWIETAEHLRPTRVRVPAGKQHPTQHTLRTSAQRLLQLADRHSDVRLVVENWHALLADAAAVNTMLDQTAGRVGFLIDLGNWTGPGKYAELAAVAHRAETCQAKVTTDPDGVIDEADYRASLQVLRDADYTGPLAMVYDGADPHEWAKLDQAYTILQAIFPVSASGTRL
jgi:sugar phosphate isomerase/epimerase